MRLQAGQPLRRVLSFFQPPAVSACTFWAASLKVGTTIRGRRRCAIGSPPSRARRSILAASSWASPRGTSSIWDLARAGRWLVVYRGKHCPICRTYLKTLDGLLDEFKAIGTTVMAVSTDPKDKAETEAREEGWESRIGCANPISAPEVLTIPILGPRGRRNRSGDCWRDMRRKRPADGNFAQNRTMARHGR